VSRALVRDSDADPGALPERALSPPPNLVTPRGLAASEAQVRELEAQRQAARAGLLAAKPVRSCPYQGGEAEIVSIEP
jgi:hypothetical protein